MHGRRPGRASLEYGSAAGGTQGSGASSRMPLRITRRISVGGGVGFDRVIPGEAALDLSTARPIRLFAVPLPRFAVFASMTALGIYSSSANVPAYGGR